MIFGTKSKDLLSGSEYEDPRDQPGHLCGQGTPTRPELSLHLDPGLCGADCEAVGAQADAPILWREAGRARWKDWLFCVACCCVAADCVGWAHQRCGV